MNRTRSKAILCLTAAWASTLWGSPAQAQQETQGAVRANTEIEAIIVTARKREESILNVPVVVTVIPKTELQNLQVIDITDLPNIVPGLIVGHEVATIGDLISIRGVGSISFDAGVDSSVLLNLDGLSLANNIAFESGTFDLQQIEVLKGPQSLYYGKSATGGVISLRTADPTDQFEITARTSYEFESVTPREEAIISGPVTDTLKLRLAAMYSTSEGYFNNVAPAAPDTGALSPTNPRAPDSEDYIVRGTVLWDPSSQFSARLKANVVHDYIINGENMEITSCPQGPSFAPFGIPFLGGYPCTLSRDEHIVYLNPANFPGILNNGVPFQDNNQDYGSLELNYRPTKDLTLTSVTGAYWLHQDSMINATASAAAGPAIDSQNLLHRRELTEEVRLNSNFASPVNFLVGGYYENGQIYYGTVILGNSAYLFPDVLANGEETTDIETHSAFGQLRWDIMPRLELAAGVRWTDEVRTETAANLQPATPTPVALAVPRIVSNHIPPEITLTYRPTDDLTAYAAFKEAYKSGSFVMGGYPPPVINAYGDEKAEGGEVGLKSLLLDRTLALNVAGYYYHFDGLQVGAVTTINTGEIVDYTENAGAARTFGIDLDGAYRPPTIAGLGFNGGASYDNARYITLNNVPCWGGQTIAAGCNQTLVNGLYTAQNLSGTPMVRAPEWQVNLGVTYELPLVNDYKMIFANNNAFASRYVTYLAVGRPNNDNYQGSYVKTGLSLSLRAPDDRWELALIGKNLTDRIIAGDCAAANLAGGAVFGGQVTGGTGAGPAGIDQVVCWADPGREVWLRLTMHL